MVRLFFYGGWGSRLIRPLGTFSHEGEGRTPRHSRLNCLLP
jgi:hypothetical protein